jgi:hypothetical protein
MRMLRFLILANIVWGIFMPIIAKEVTLQEGVDGYTGCEDVSVISAGANTKIWPTGTDTVVTYADFHC